MSAPSPPPPPVLLPEVPPVGGYRSDPMMFTAVLMLTALGVVMVYSSSAIFAQLNFPDSRHFLVRNLMWVTMGLCAMAVTMRLDYRIYRRFAYPMLGTAFL